MRLVIECSSYLYLKPGQTKSRAEMDVKRNYCSSGGIQNIYFFDFFLRKNILFLFNYEYMYYVACMSYARLVFVLYFKLAHWYLQSIG